MFLGFDNYKSLIDQAVSMGTLSVKLNNMNEPLLLPDIERYIRYAKDQGIVNIFFSTNGTLLTAEKSRMLIDSGLTKLFISIDAVTPETYYAQRGSTRFNTVVRNVNQFIDIRNESGKSYPLVRVNFLKNKLNLHEVDQFLEYWKNRADIVIFQEMYERVDKKSDLMITDKKTEFRCSFPFKLMAVRSNGDILPCCTMHGQRMVVGNISEMSLIDAWNSKLMYQLRKIHINGDFEKFPICNYCVNGV